MNDKRSLIKIGVFYDGNYFYHVSNYYTYYHPRKSRLSISGLHEFVRNQVANEEGTDARHCQIVDAHYFRGRLSALEASFKGNLLYYERAFDDILMLENVVTHYLPLRNMHGKTEEKGIDVWLALEAFELCFHKRFDVIVLIAADYDYVPLIRKLNTLGVRVMVLSWDFETTNQEGTHIVTRTSQDLLEEVTYPIAMHELIDNRLRKSDPLINNLFVPPSQTKVAVKTEPKGDGNVAEILKLKEGYGFLKWPPNNIFFHYSSVTGVDFNDLKEGDRVEFALDRGEQGNLIAKNVRLVGKQNGSSGE